MLNTCKACEILNIYLPCVNIFPRSEKYITSNAVFFYLTKMAKHPMEDVSISLLAGEDKKKSDNFFD